MLLFNKFIELIRKGYKYGNARKRSAEATRKAI